MNGKDYPDINKKLILWGIKEYDRINEKQKEDKLDNELFINIGPEVRRRGYLKKEELVKIGRWKSPRQLNNYKKNSNEKIREISEISFNQNRSEEVRIEILGLLSWCWYSFCQCHFNSCLSGKVWSD